MSGEQPPLTCKEIKAILAYLGFAFSAQEGSHEQWVLIKNGKKFKVTVDCPKSPFSQMLIKSMAAQAGCKKKGFLLNTQKVMMGMCADNYGKCQKMHSLN